MAVAIAVHAHLANVTDGHSGPHSNVRQEGTSEQVPIIEARYYEGELDNIYCPSELNVSLLLLLLLL